MEYETTVAEIEVRDGASSSETQMVARLNELKNGIRAIEVDLYQEVDEVGEGAAALYNVMFDRLKDKKESGTISESAFATVAAKYSQMLRRDITEISGSSKAAIDALVDRVRGVIDKAFKELDEIQITGTEIGATEEVSVESASETPGY
jgi:hypothetical protein